VKPGAAVHPIIAALGPLQVDGLSLTDIARHRATASKLIDKVGFDRK
jgi:iron(III) transport system substrate-binding protein